MFLSDVDLLRVMRIYYKEVSVRENRLSSLMAPQTKGGRMEANMGNVIVSSNGVDCYEQDGTVYLRLENVARGLGITEEKNGVEYVMWRRVNVYLKDMGFSTEVSKDTFIPENIFYRLAMKARNETAERFQALVADEIIPSIRRTGFYSTGRGLADRTKLEMEIMGVKAIADHLRMDDASILAMYERLYEDKGLSTSFIPEYADAGNHVAMSLTELLRKNGCDIKSAAFNKMLVADGYLEDRERTSSKKDEDGNVVMKKFKVLTDKGLAYGKNVVSRHNTRETQPLYFEDTFMDLYGKVMG